MKILERYDQTKTVEAWGETWTVPVWADFLAIDKDGEVVAHSNQPKDYSVSWIRTGTTEKAQYIAIVSDFGDWRESLVYVGDQ